MENMRFKIETVTSSKLKGTTWEDVDVDVGDIAMIFISYGRAVSHLQFLYVKDGKFSISERHGDPIENLEIGLSEITSLASRDRSKVCVYFTLLRPDIMGFVELVVVIRAKGPTKTTSLLPRDRGKIKLDYPSEYLVGVNGRHGGADRILKSITFMTNKKSYGPFPKNKPTYMTSEDTEFNINVLDHGWLNGFHGTIFGGQLESIGVYIKPMPIINTPKKDIDYEKIDVIDG